MTTWHATSDFGGRYFLWAHATLALPYFGVIIVSISNASRHASYFHFVPHSKCVLPTGKLTHDFYFFSGEKQFFLHYFLFVGFSEDSSCKSWKIPLAPVVMLLEPKTNRPCGKSYFFNKRRRIEKLKYYRIFASFVFRTGAACRCERPTK